MAKTAPKAENAGPQLTAEEQQQRAQEQRAIAAQAKAQNAEKVQAQHMGFDPLRPVRYAGAFVWGTAKGGMDGMAKGGRLGLKLGALYAVASWFLLAGVATGGVGGLLGLMAMYGVYGFAGGAALSGSLGLLVGGTREVGRAYRKEKYADDLAVKQEARVQHARRYVSYDDRYAHHRRAASYNIDRLAQQDQRTESDLRTYWRDRVSNEGRDSGRGF